MLVELFNAPCFLKSSAKLLLFFDLTKFQNMFYGTKVRYSTYVLVDFQYLNVFSLLKKVRH